MDALMSMIDDVKTKLTDEEYKQLCDKMMELNKKHEGYYRVWYVITETEVLEDREEVDDEEGKPCQTRYYHKFDNVVVKLTNSLVAEMRNSIKETGHCCAHYRTLKLSPRENLPIVGASKYALGRLFGHLQPIDENHHSVFRIDDLE